MTAMAQKILLGWAEEAPNISRRGGGTLEDYLPPSWGNVQLGGSCQARWEGWAQAQARIFSFIMVSMCSNDHGAGNAMWWHGSKQAGGQV